MKKTLYSMLVLAMAALTFTGCEDVPAPYEIPNSGDNNGGGTTVEGVYLDQSFASSLGDFTSVSASGTLKWYNDYSSAMITGYQDFNGDGVKENQAGVTYLVSQEIDLTSAENAYLTINHALNYERGDINDDNSVLISSNYTGDVNTATWTMLKYDTEGLNSSFDFVEKNVNIPAEFIGNKVVVALRHTCSSSNSSTWEVKSLKIQKGQVETPDTPSGDVLTPVNGTYINESFGSSFGVFTLTSVEGTPWVIDSYGYAKATGYDNASKTTTPSKSYLVSKPMDMSSSENVAVEFDYVLRYVTTSAGDPIDGIENKVLITANYTGDPTTTQWTDITGTMTEGRDWTFSSHKISVPSDFVGKGNVVIALYYACNTSSGTWEVKNFTVKEDNGGSTGGGDDTGDITSANGDFETWVDGKPNNWSTESTAGNATLSQSTDAHGGKYSVQVGGSSSANKRIGYKEMTLEAGDYTMTFWTKAATSAGGAVRPGIVPVTDGKVGQYAYGDYTNDLTNTSWVQVTHSFTITESGTYCLVIMNSRNPGADVLIDDFTLSLGSNVIIK